VQVLVASVNAVDKVAENAAHPVSALCEARSRGHLGGGWLVAHSGLLVHGLDLARVEMEGLFGLAAKDHHLVVVEHDAAGGLRAHED
jgi:hypothetical protein